MAEPTRRGLKLAYELNFQIGSTRKTAETCSLITRHAKTYCRIQEIWCSVDLYEGVMGDPAVAADASYAAEVIANNERLRRRGDRLTANYEANEKWLEARILRLVEDLPQPDDGPWRVEFQGDPRGNTVRLIAPDGREYGCDNP